MFHKVINKETKKFNLTLLFSCKFSWEFSRKNECDKLINKWRVIFKVLDDKSRNFIDLLDNNLNSIELMYAKERSWLKYFSYSNLLCVRATRAIVNHTLISKYRLRFFPREEFICLYGEYPIEIRRHILHEYIRFNKYWNSRRDIIAHFTLFLEFNSNTFSKEESIT